MTDNNTNAPRQGSGLGALVTTGIVSAIAAFSASLLYFHYFPQVKKEPAPIAIVDMVKLGMSVTKMSKEGDASAFMNTGHAIAMLKEYGYIVLDSRMVITAPDVYWKKPSDLIVGAPDMDNGPGGYTPPNLMQGVNDDGNSQHR